jgi:hypothetical protein
MDNKKKMQTIKIKLYSLLLLFFIFLIFFMFESVLCVGNKNKEGNNDSLEFINYAVGDYII